MILIALMAIAQAATSPGAQYLAIEQLGVMASAEARCAHEPHPDRYMIEAASVRSAVAERLTEAEMQATAVEGGEVHPGRCPRGRTGRYYRDMFGTEVGAARGWLSQAATSILDWR